MKIVREELLISCGPYAKSREWTMTRSKLHMAIRRVSWPPGSKSFTIFPESGRKRGEGNGVKPIKDGLMVELRSMGWQTPGIARNRAGDALGAFDAVSMTNAGSCVLEWETGNISSSHRSLNKMAMLLGEGQIVAGTLVVPSREFYRYLTDRVGNIQELEPYFGLWRSVRCESGILEIIVIEHDATSRDVPRIPKGTDGRALA